MATLALVLLFCRGAAAQEAPTAICRRGELRWEEKFAANLANVKVASTNRVAVFSPLPF